MSKINPRMVTLARESREMVLADLGAKLKMTPQGVRALEQNYHNMNVESLNNLCQALNYPESFFFQAGESLPLPFSIRRSGEVPAKHLDALDANVNIYRLNMEKLIASTGISEPKLPMLDLADLGSPQACAHELRKLWKVKDGPIGNLSELMEAHKIFLISYDFGTDLLDGKCTIASDHYPMIVTNKSLLGDRQRFTLAYHLGYLVMHWKTLPDIERSYEISHEAKQFAAEFLMPQKDIQADLKDLEFDMLPALKKKWKSSMVSLVYRSEDVGMTTYNQKTYLMKQFNKHGIKRREPKQYDVPVEKYKLVRDLITTYKKKQRFNYAQMAEYFCLYEDEFSQRYDFN